MSSPERGTAFSFFWMHDIYSHLDGKEDKECTRCLRGLRDSLNSPNSLGLQVSQLCVGELIEHLMKSLKSIKHVLVKSFWVLTYVETLDSYKMGINK